MGRELEYGYEGVYEILGKPEECRSPRWNAGEVASESELLRYGVDLQDCDLVRLIGFVRLPKASS